MPPVPSPEKGLAWSVKRILRTRAEWEKQNNKVGNPAKFKVVSVLLIQLLCVDICSCICPCAACVTVLDVNIKLNHHIGLSCETDMHVLLSCIYSCYCQCYSCYDSMEILYSIGSCIPQMRKLGSDICDGIPFIKGICRFVEG